MLDRRSAQRVLRRQSIELLVQVVEHAQSECEHIRALGSTLSRTSAALTPPDAASRCDTPADIAEVVDYASLLTRHVGLMVEMSKSLSLGSQDAFVSNVRLVTQCLRALSSIRRVLEYRVGRTIDRVDATRFGQSPERPH